MRCGRLVAMTSSACVRSLPPPAGSDAWLWRIGTAPFDHFGMRAYRSGDATVVELQKFSLAGGEASVSATLPGKIGPQTIGFRFSSDSGIELVANGKVIASNLNASAKTTMTVGNNNHVEILDKSVTVTFSSENA